MKHFSKPLQNARHKQNEAVIGKGFRLPLWTSSCKRWACKPLQLEEEAAASARRGADGPRVQERQRYHGLPQNQLGV